MVGGKVFIVAAVVALVDGFWLQADRVRQIPRRPIKVDFI